MKPTVWGGEMAVAADVQQVSGHRESTAALPAVSLPLVPTAVVTHSITLSLSLSLFLCLTPETLLR